MMNKKHLLLGLGSMITLALVSAMVVSCGKEEKNNELNENSIVSDWQFTLNSKGQQISADPICSSMQWNRHINSF